jgi:V/A-type H+-transporting ATPase subunit C
MNYSGINGKIKSMRSKLLKKSDYIHLGSFKRVSEVAKGLENFQAYYEQIHSIDVANLSRNHIENRLSLSIMYDFERIYKFIHDYKSKKYLGAYFLRHEILIIKLILSMIHDKRNTEYKLPELNFLLRDKLNIDLNKLKNSASIEECIDNLRATEFYDVVSDTYERTHSLFELEIKLDIYYYMHLWSLQKKYLSFNDKNVMSLIIGTEIDLTNISWLYRMKKYYTIDPTHIYSYLIPIRYRINSNEMSSLINANTIPEFQEAINNTFYFSEFKDNKLSIEQIFYKNMFKVYKKSCMMFGNSLANVVYYIYLKELEINNISSLIECVRYRLSQEKVMDHIYLQEA